MNPRKRRAEEPLLPLRSSKHTRQSHLRTDGQPASPTQTEGILSKWISIGSDLVKLTVETFNTILQGPSTSEPLLPTVATATVYIAPPSPLPRHPADTPQKPDQQLSTRSNHRLPPRRNLPLDWSTSSARSSTARPFTPSNLGLGLSASSSSYSSMFKPSIMALPSRDRGLKRNQSARKSRLKEPESVDPQSSSHAGPSKPKHNGAASRSHSPSYSQVVESAIHEASRSSARSSSKSRTPRPHIFEDRHKKRVREETKKTREEIVRELYELERKKGFRSTQVDFEGLLDYRAQLEAAENKSNRNLRSVSSSASLSNLGRVPIRADRSRRHSLGTPLHATDDFLRSALEKARRTLAAPPPPPPFAPTLDKLKILARNKDQSIESRLRPTLPASLPPADDAHVTNVLKKKGVIAKYAREQVSDHDMAKLHPSQWLNDELINFYGAMILGRSEESKENPGSVNGVSSGKPLDVHYFNTFFFQKLSQDGYQKARLAKWTKKVDIFSKDIVLIPVNHRNSHWTAAAINFRKKRIESYDSMGMANEAVFKHLRAYLDAEHQNKKNKPMDWTNWVNYRLDDTPQQENGFDCGVFTCQFMETLARGEERFTFTQTNMKFMRRKMVWEISNKRFWTPTPS